MRGKSPRGLDTELYGETNEKDSWGPCSQIASSQYWSAEARRRFSVCHECKRRPQNKMAKDDHPEMSQSVKDAPPAYDAREFLILSSSMNLTSCSLEEYGITPGAAPNQRNICRTNKNAGCRTLCGFQRVRVLLFTLNVRGMPAVAGPPIRSSRPERPVFFFRSRTRAPAAQWRDRGLT